MVNEEGSGTHEGSSVSLERVERPFRQYKYKFVAHGDFDGRSAGLLYQFLHEIPDNDIRWVFVGAGRRLGADFPGQIVIHFDTGGLFDEYNYDHHQGGEKVKGECATSLVLRFVPDFDERPDAAIIREYVEYVRISDTGIQPFGVRSGWPPSLIKNVYGMQAILDRSVPLHTQERRRICREHFRAWYHASLRDVAFMDELLKGEKLSLLMIPSVGAVVATGNTEHDSGELRNLFKNLVNPKFRNTLRNKPGYPVDFIVCRYISDTRTGSDKIGVTNVLKGRWPRLDMWEIAEKVHRLYPHVPPPPPREKIKEIGELEDARDDARKKIRELEREIAQHAGAPEESGAVANPDGLLGRLQAEFDLISRTIQELEDKIAEKKKAIEGPVYVDHRNFVVYWYLPDAELNTDMVLRALVYVLRDAQEEEREELSLSFEEFDFRDEKESLQEQEDEPPKEPPALDTSSALAKLRDIQKRAKALLDS